MNQKVVLITGASTGIGKAIGLFLQEKGYLIYGTSRNPEKYSSQSQFTLLPLDVADQKSIQDVVSNIIQQEGRLDILINNAGAGITGPLEEIPSSEILQNFTTNYFGPIDVTKAVLPQMRTQKEGLVIHITSIAGYMGLPYRGIYSAAKAALEITSEAWRMELKEFNIKMTTIAPGAFATNIAVGRYHAPLLDDSPYLKNYGRTLELINQDVDGGQDPIVIAKEVYEIIKKNNPKVHYRIGAFLQKFSITLKKVLPDTIYENMLRKHFEL
ncbi:SDR family oxidoreductase [Aquimarina sp. ERC-38]|uniref:SDR family oxidoreductase n=1 Tax=Aquimarina sp. ERC-38 TaxID=2949996 RepID=UPI002247562E|nr:SDR family oxidoreductase [Aquimarina sp. ERC-38]UZO79876.1 SDR family oxidoreductase [Aquimarina sp. ERC-38]